MNNQLITLALSALLAIIVLSSCSNKNDTDVYPLDAQLTIYLEHVVGDEALSFDNIKYKNSFGNIYSVARLQYFISDIVLHHQDGSIVYIDEEYYVDGRDASSMILMPTQKIPNGDYEKVDFIFGLTEDKNIAGRFPNPPENNMEWPPALGSGYHYMKLEGKVDSAGTINNFQAHTGPAYDKLYYVKVTLKESYFNANSQQAGFVISMDINKWWESPNVLDLNTVTMIMGNPDMQLMLNENGWNVFKFLPLITIND